MVLTTRQQEIIEAAGKLLTTYGLSGLTIKNLAREMHFAESAIYRHFNSKEDIIISMLQYLAENIENRLKRIDPDLSPEESMKQLLEGQFRFFKAHSHFVMAVFSDGLMEESQRINKHILNLIQIKTRYLTPIIIKGQQNGNFTDDVSPEQLVHIIMGTFKLEILKWRIAGFQYDLQKAGDEMLHSILTLIKKQKPC
jgi:AcrR family transcriptional regulator